MKTTESAGMSGYDAGQRIKGRKRHIVTDTVGLRVGLAVHGANIQDRDGAPDLLESISGAYPPRRHIFAPSGDIAVRCNAGQWMEVTPDQIRGALEKIGRWTLQIVKRSDTAQGFKVMPRRLSWFASKPLPGSGWVVERTFAWLGRCHRMAKDGEKTIASAQAWLLIAHIRRVTRMLASS